ncbi:MAG: 30S ribosomal protein S18 [Chloroflexota bacterium]|nr:30S ribosomal protein S18 [Chloroflexota bacterium]
MSAYRHYRHHKPRYCRFCSDANIDIDHKNIDVLENLVFNDGKIRPRRQTGTCAKHQRQITKAVKRARHLALLPFAGEVLR